MSYFQSTYHSKIYRDFKEIEANAYRQVIHFFEKKEDEIKQLDFEEYFELLVAYVNALFETGAYQKHILTADLVIENTIVHNIEVFKGEDLFRKMLFKKAASLYNILEYDRADYILRELIRIDPFNDDNSMFLKKCLRKKFPDLVNYSRAASIFLFLLTTFVLCIEVLLVRPFYNMHAELVEISRNSTIILACVFWFGGDLIHRWQVEKEVNRFVAGAREEKRSKSGQ